MDEKVYPIYNTTLLNKRLTTYICMIKLPSKTFQNHFIFLTVIFSLMNEFSGLCRYRLWHYDSIGGKYNVLHEMKWKREKTTFRVSE